MIGLRIVNQLARAEAWVEAYFQHEGLTFNDSVRRGILALLQDSKWGHFWEVVEGDVAVGYVVLTYGFDHEVGGPLGMVTDFYLIESARGRGIGSKVIEHVRAHCVEQGLAALQLFVLDHNPSGRRFYERNGLRAFDDRRIMSLELYP